MNMTPEKRARVNELFAVAVETDSASTARLDLENEDEDVRLELARLLRLHLEAAESFVRPPSESDFPSTFRPGEVVASRYTILERVGHGGMGEVYRAQDSTIDAVVALKTILPRFLSDEAASRRFRQELSLARRVTHPNVCRVFDLQTHEDAESGESVSFITMEYLEGVTLARRLDAKGRFTFQEALPFLLQLARGIEAAHTAGVIHRDLKALNVMLVPNQDGSERAVITDFGLARHSIRPIPDGRTATMSRHIMGTPAYMAPELLLGAQASPVTDLYGFGVIQFEMATGRRPAPGAGERPRSIVPDLDPRWDAAIVKCLDPSPALRFQSAAELIEALSPATKGVTRRVAAFGAVALLLILLLLVGTNRDWLRARLAGVPDKKRVAVLPFVPMAEGEEQRAFADGITETITNQLTGIEQFQKALLVVPAAEIRSRKLTGVEEARKAFGATLVLTGSVHRENDAIAVTANLIDARGLKQLASRTVQVPTSSGAEMPAKVTAAAAEMLGIDLPAGASRVISAGQTQNAEAYRLYQEGLGYLRRFEQENVVRAIALFHQAVEKDSTFALGFTRLGEAYWRKYTFSKNPADVDLARAQVNRALQLDPNSAAAHTALASILVGTGNYAQSVDEYRRALELSPSDGDALAGLAKAYSEMGRFPEAEATYKKAIEVRPDLWSGYLRKGAFHYSQGHFEEARRMFEMVAELTPESVVGYRNLGGVLIQLKRYPEAERALRKALELRPTAEAYSNLSVCASFQGRHREAVELLRKAVALDTNNDRLWRNLGDAYLAVPELSSQAAGAYRNALEAVTRRLTVNPNSAELLLGAALYAAKLKQSAAARQYMTKALATGPLSASLLFECGVVWEVLGERDRALDALAEAVKKGFSGEQLLREPELEKLRKDERFSRIVRP
jgi:tetratricopeptide (TPR) repeat protein/TolB-like protein